MSFRVHIPVPICVPLHAPYSRWSMVRPKNLGSHSNDAIGHPCMPSEREWKSTLSIWRIKLPTSSRAELSRNGLGNRFKSMSKIKKASQFKRTICRALDAIMILDQELIVRITYSTRTVLLERL